MKDNIKAGTETRDVSEMDLSWSNTPMSSFGEHCDSWDALNLAGPDLPVLDSAFFELLASEFCSGGERVLIGKSEGRPVVAAILERARRGAWQTIQPAQAPLGAWLQQIDVPIESLLNSLTDQLSGPTFVTGVSQQDPGFLHRPVESRHLRTLDYIDTASVTVGGEFTDYWSARGRNLRQNLRRQRNRLKRAGTIPRLEIVTEGHAMDSAVDEYGLLETSGWKSQQGTALHPENSQGRFYKALLQHFCSRGESIVFRYMYGDKLVACDLCLHRNGVILILKTAYDEEMKKSSPAMLMREESFEYIFGCGHFRRIEFYGKVMDWHTKWSGEIRRLYHVNYHRSALVGRLFDLASGRYFAKSS